MPSHASLNIIVAISKNFISYRIVFEQLKMSIRSYIVIKLYTLKNIYRFGWHEQPNRNKDGR